MASFFSNWKLFPIPRSYSHCLFGQFVYKQDNYSTLTTKARWRVVMGVAVSDTLATHHAVLKLDPAACRISSTRPLGIVGRL